MIQSYCSRWSFVVSALAVIAFSCLPSQGADVIYRETFGRTNGSTGNLNPSIFGWQHFLASGSAETGGNGISADGTGKPIDVANVNAGPNRDGDFSAQPEGWHYLDGTRRMSFTPEYQLNLADVVGSLTFSWYQGNAQILAGTHLILRLGSTWYVSAAGKTNTAAVTAGANFGLETGGAGLMSVVFDPAAANWNLLNFDGDFDHVSLTRTASTLGAPTAGATPGADLAGTITAFGLWRPRDNTGFGNSRFDTFTLEATLVPEPTTFALLVVGVLGFLACRLCRG